MSKIKQMMEEWLPEDEEAYQDDYIPTEHTHEYYVNLGEPEEWGGEEE